ncbi:LacI family DNA-binding transcriptional regulator [Psychromicrobium sp. YIM B11713]|uniref:LacI family DNA-binding transcriptional regulator n=1 Tax=Psychromicrobium sp. YIM B11713 TaxID=3145233 RepID=UPI00374F4D1F
MRVTLKDIAAEAGVSVMTVSNVMNGNRDKVSEATIERVHAIVQRRGYVANASARSLAAKTSRLVGLIVPSADEDVLVLSPHNVAVFGFLERHLRERGYHLLFRGVTETAEVDVAVRSWNLDGAVVLGFLDEEVDGFATSSAPILALDSYSANPWTSGVRSDDREGGRLAAEHLLSLGHRRIAFASPTFSDVGLVRQRFDGFLQAHHDAGVEWHPSDLIGVDPTWEVGVEVGRALPTEHPDVTAVFATADILAVGIIEGLRAVGRSVPDDLSVVGFDDIDLAHYVTPKLTTIRQDVAAKGSIAAKLLLAEIEGGTMPGDPVVIPVDLVIRGSTAAR